MLTRTVDAALAAAERRLGLPGSMDYLRFLARQSRTAFAKFTLLLPLASHRRRLPVGVFVAARIAASRHQDCGTCLQVEVAQGRQLGVAPALLQALAAGREEEMPAEIAEAYRFSRAVAAQEPGADALREAVRARWGDAGLAELALAVATAQLFPITKRALGMARSCSLVQVEV